MPNANDQVRITLKTAKYIVETAAKLWAAGTGTRMLPPDPLQTLPDDYFNQQPGFLDELPGGNDDLIEWAHALLSLARFVAGIINHQIDDIEE
jgi:hypothetical protein